MNRTSFLSTLPFLYDLHSSDWPPSISEDTGATRRQFLFRDHCLSFGVPLNQEEEALGTCYFFPSLQQQQGSFDPATCKVEMVLFTTPKKKTPYKQSRTPNKSPGASKKAVLEVEYKEFIAFMSIDDRIYQVDLNAMQGVTLKGLQSAVITPPTPPPCLLLQFPTCWFRIFSLVGDPTNQYAILNSGKSEIENVLNGAGENYYPFPTPALESLTSPMGSSTAQSSEPGQRESALQEHESARSSSQDSSRKSTSVPDMEQQSKAKTQKSQACLNAAQEDLVASRKLFTKSGAPRTQSTKEIETTASNLLTSVADNFTASYCTQEELLAAAHEYDQDMESNRAELHKLCKAFFPATKRPSKRSRNSHKTSKVAKDPKVDAKTKEAAIHHAERMLAEHKQALRGKYALAMLPTRG